MPIAVLHEMFGSLSLPPITNLRMHRNQKLTNTLLPQRNTRFIVPSKKSHKLSRVHTLRNSNSSANMDDETCADEFSARIWKYHWLVVVALFLISGKFLLFQKFNNGWLNLIAGCITTTFAMSLMTVFWPYCPDGCTCGDFFALFPCLSLLLGLGWIHDGAFAVAGYRIRNAHPDSPYSNGFIQLEEGTLE